MVNRSWACYSLSSSILVFLVPKLCLGMPVRETPVSRSRGGFDTVRETEFRGQCVPKQSLGTRSNEIEACTLEPLDSLEPLERLEPLVKA